MKAEILKENFKKALNAVERVTRKAISLPVLQNVLITAKGNFLELTTTNLETTIKWWVLAKVIQEGRIAAPATFLANLVNLISEEKIELVEDNKNLILKTASQTTTLKGQEPEDFPIIPKINRKEAWFVSCHKLALGLMQTVDIPSTSQIRPEISGLYFQVKKDFLKIVGTDSFRLAEKTLRLEKIGRKEDEFILPQNSAREILNIASQEQGQAAVFSDENQILFQVKGEQEQAKVEVLARAIEGKFPNYKEIIPKKTVAQIRLNKQDFEQQIKKAGLFSGKVLEARLTSFPQENKLKIFSQSAEAGSSQSFLSCSLEGEAVETAFNYKFLDNGLSQIKSSEVILEISGDEGPGVLKPVGEPGYLYILMPIKNT